VYDFPAIGPLPVFDPPRCGWTAFSGMLRFNMAYNDVSARRQVGAFLRRVLSGRVNLE